ncbi:MAG: YcjF family protein [Candidatus Coproplasma sp.]
MKSNRKKESAVANSATLTSPVTKADGKSPSAKSGENKKMTIYEYEEKHVKHRNSGLLSTIMYLIVALIGVLLIWGLFSVSKSVWDINEYAGYVAIGVSVILFIVLYIVPIVKIFRMDYFKTDVTSKTALKAKRHNKKVRADIAQKIVDMAEKVEGGLYDYAVVEKLSAGVKLNDDEVIKEQLTALYKGSVKKSANDIIFKSSLKSAMYSALSQDSKIDTMLIVVVNLQMIKDIVYLYGFRPSDSRLAKIFASVVRNSLIAYGLGNVKIGNGIVRTMGDAFKGIPFLGSVISTLVDSSVQGLANGILTAVIGYQTIKYLTTEYNLQNVLDSVEITETQEEFEETCIEIEKELKKAKPAKA